MLGLSVVTCCHTKDEFVYAVTAAEGIILSLFTMNNEDKMILSAAVTA